MECVQEKSRKMIKQKSREVHRSTLDRDKPNLKTQAVNREKETQSGHSRSVQSANDISIAMDDSRTMLANQPPDSLVCAPDAPPLSFGDCAEEEGVEFDMEDSISTNRGLSCYENVLRPFTDSQLRALYCNSELEANEQFMDYFFSSQANLGKSEFYNIVNAYYKARAHLLTSLNVINTNNAQFSTQSEKIWVFQPKRVKSSGKCMDNKLVETFVDYEHASINKSVMCSAEKALQTIQDELLERHAMSASSAQTARVQIEAYLYRLLECSSNIAHLPKNAPVVGTIEEDSCLNSDEIRCCASVLFSFTRRPIKDEEFVKDVKQWLSLVVAVMMRQATFSDHLFLLNHILRCPAGVSDWALSYLQIPPLTQQGEFNLCTNLSSMEGVENPTLNHALTVLATLLSPIKFREEFLRYMEVTQDGTTAADDVRTWVLLDSEGEEDEDPVKSWSYLKENDLVGLLCQIPFGDIFRQMLGMKLSDGMDWYDSKFGTPAILLRTLAFATVLVGIFRQGFETFGPMVRYKQFAKRLSRLIRHVVQYVTDHWEASVAQLDQTDSMFFRVQIEYDHFFLRATKAMFFSQKSGAWQFMAVMPYSRISSSMMWHVYWLLHRQAQPQMSSEHLIDYKSAVKDVSEKQQFEDFLSLVEENEIYYLLSTFINMAVARSASEDRDFIDLVATEVFQLSYVFPNTRRSFSKPGRELLSHLANQHQFVMSTLILEVKSNMDKIGNVAIYLFSDLPLDIFEPNELDIEVICDWLINSQLTAPENQLARAILQRMNWGYTTSSSDLFIPWSVHRKIAVSLVEAIRSRSSEQGAQATNAYIPSLIGGDASFNAFEVWCWNFVLSLKLHAFSLPDQLLTRLVGAVNGVADMDRLRDIVPDMQMDPKLFGLLKGGDSDGVAKNSALSSYVALVLTKIGHSMSDFLQNVDHLATLIEFQHVEAAIRVLFHITPLFYDNRVYLSTNNRFLEVLALIVNHQQQSYLSAAKNYLSGTVVTDTTLMLTNMIMFQVRTAYHSPNTKTPLLLWFEMLTRIPEWNSCQNALYIVNKLLQAAFLLKEDTFAAREALAELYKDTASSPSSSRQPLNWFFSWVASGSAQSLPTFLPKSSNPDIPYLAYFVLDMETKFEDESLLWKSVLREMADNTKMGPEAALKKAAASLNLPMFPAHHLAIYRLAQHAVDAPTDHPMTPFFWQRFFMLYLCRVSPGSGEAANVACVGSRFFDGRFSSFSGFDKTMKKRLRELAEHYRDLAGRVTEVKEKAPFYDKLCRLYRTFGLWLEEARLSDAALYLPALPAQYEPNKLLQIFQNSKELWMEYVDLPLIADEVKVFGYTIEPTPTRLSRRTTQGTLQGKDSEESMDVASRIIHRLQMYETPVEAPPLIRMKRPVGAVDAAMFTHDQGIVYGLKQPLGTLMDYAMDFSERLSKQAVLDCQFSELVPLLYRNVEEKEVRKVGCPGSTGSNGQRLACKGKAILCLTFAPKQLNESVRNQVDTNRQDWKLGLTSFVKPDLLNCCTASVYIENVITELIKCYHKTSEIDHTSNLRPIYAQTGIRLFYHLVEYLNKESQLYPPTKDFFLTSLAVLGQVFVQDEPSQVEPLFRLISDRPELVLILGVQWTPAAADVQTFLRVYVQLTDGLKSGNSEYLIVLLSKIKMGDFLMSRSPGIADRKQMIGKTGEALFKLGKKPKKTMRTIYEIYQEHFITLSVNQFPDLYPDTLRILLSGCDSNVLCVDIWRSFVNTLLANIQLSIDFSPEAPFSIDLSPLLAQFAVKQSLFSWQTLHDSCRELSAHFAEKRTASDATRNFGLYPVYKDYVQPLSYFAAMIAHGFVAEEVKNFEGRTVSTEEVWHLIRKLFSPWIEPIFSEFDDNLSVATPWLEADASVAEHLVVAFCHCLNFAHQLVKNQRSVLTLFLDHYLKVYVRQEVGDHVLRLIHTHALKILPWGNFYPDLSTLNIILKVLEGNMASCVSFVGAIFIQIQWPEVIQRFCDPYAGHPFQVVAYVHCVLLRIFVSLSCCGDREIAASDRLARLLDLAQGFQWHLVDLQAYDSAARWYGASSEPAWLVANNGSSEKLPIKLLQAAAHFNPSLPLPVPAHPDTAQKRLIYIRTVVRIMYTISMNYPYPVPPTTSSELTQIYQNYPHVFAEIFQLIEAVLTLDTSGGGLDAANFEKEASRLIGEALLLLNMVHCPEVSHCLLAAFRSFVMGCPRSALLVPLVVSSCKTLTTLAHMVAVCENCIESYFQISCDQNAAECGWSLFVQKLSVLESIQADFITECLNQGAFLTLHLYLSDRIYRLGSSSIVEQERLELLTQVADWCNRAKPTVENESKMFLLWWRISELLIDAARAKEDQAVLMRLVETLAQSIIILGHDKQTTGLWAAIGLGKRSPHSVGFRLVSRAMTSFLLHQVTADGLRLTSDTPNCHDVSPASQQALQQLVLTKTDKTYSEFRQQSEFLVDFVRESETTLLNTKDLLNFLCNNFFPNKHYLKVILHNSA